MDDDVTTTRLSLARARAAAWSAADVAHETHALAIEAEEDWRRAWEASGSTPSDGEARRWESGAAARRAATEAAAARACAAWARAQAADIAALVADLAGRAEAGGGR